MYTEYEARRIIAGTRVISFFINTSAVKAAVRMSAAIVVLNNSIDTATGCITAVPPPISSMFSMFDPMIVPALMLGFFFTAPAITTLISGRDVPTATIVTPITACEVN